MYDHILHPTDLSAEHFKIAQRAADIACKFDAKLYLLHVIEPPPTLQLAQGMGFAEFDNPEQIMGDAAAVMATLGEALGVPEEQQSIMIGTTSHEIVNQANLLRCSMIIVGKEASLLPSLFQDLSTVVVKGSRCDVMILDNNM